MTNNILVEIEKQAKELWEKEKELISKANAYDELVILANDRLDIIDRLKQENEQLKKQLEFSRTHKTVLDAERIKYKQALEEIREIINEQNLISDKSISLSEFALERLCNYEEKYIKIVDKINEVLNDRD